MKFKHNSIYTFVIIGILAGFTICAFAAKGPLYKQLNSYNSKQALANRQQAAQKWGDAMKAADAQANVTADQQAQQQLQAKQDAGKKAYAGLIDQQKVISSDPASDGKPQSRVPKGDIKSLCDCYSSLDVFNYKSNFKYNDKNERVSRIKPACTCKPKSGSASSAVQTTTTTATTTTGKSQTTTPVILSTGGGSATGASSGSTWKINYN